MREREPGELREVRQERKVRRGRVPGGTGVSRALVCVRPYMRERVYVFV